MKGEIMGKIMYKVTTVARKTKEAVVKNGPALIKTAGLTTLSYLAGYGIGNLIADVSGARKQSYQQVYDMGKKVGWSNGYEDGMTASAVLEGVKNGVIEPQYLGSGVES